MDQSKFFYIQIQGDGLDAIKLKNKIGLPCETFFKGQKISDEPTNETIIIETNRWSYFDMSHDDTSIEEFLTKNLKKIIEKRSILRQYVNKYESFMEIDIHVREVTSDFNVCLSKHVITMLHKIGIQFNINFLDL